MGALSAESGEEGRERKFLVRQWKKEREGQNGWREGRGVTKGGSKERKTQLQGGESRRMEGK